MQLLKYGWTRDFASAWHDLGRRDCQPGRVAATLRGSYKLFTENGEADAELTGRLRFETASAADLPVTGDWVAFDGARIHCVLPRRCALLRKQAGLRTEAQVLAANVDVCFLVSGLDGDFNPRRIERYIAMVRESGSRPVIVLNKADLCADWASVYEALDIAAPRIPVIALSAKTGNGLEQLANHIQPGQTGALLGSSGVGKSTLINALLDDQRQRTNDVRASDSRGKHTTTHRELVLLESGWLLLDMPGIRELQPWNAEAGIGSAFGEIGDLAENCRFRDCTHTTEPGCAVLAALNDGRLAEERIESYRKLEREAAHLRRKVDIHEANAHRNEWKRIHKQMRRNPKQHF